MFKYDKIVFIIYGIDANWARWCLEHAAAISEASYQSLVIVFFDGSEFYRYPYPLLKYNPLKDDLRKGYTYRQGGSASVHKFKRFQFLERVDARFVFQGLTSCSKIAWNSHGGGDPFTFSSFDNAKGRKLFSPQALGAFFLQNITCYASLDCLVNPESSLTIDLLACNAGFSDSGCCPAALAVMRELQKFHINCHVTGRGGIYGDKGFVDLGYFLPDREEYERITMLDSKGEIVEEEYRKAPKSKVSFAACDCGNEVALFVYEYEKFLHQFLLAILEYYSKFSIFNVTELKSKISWSHNSWYLSSCLDYEVKKMSMPDKSKTEFIDAVIEPVQAVIKQFPLCRSCFMHRFQAYFMPRKFSELMRLFDVSCSDEPYLIKRPTTVESEARAVVRTLTC